MCGELGPIGLFSLAKLHFDDYLYSSKAIAFEKFRFSLSRRWCNVPESDSAETGITQDCLVFFEEWDPKCKRNVTCRDAP